jgi:fatty acid desaturase
MANMSVNQRTQLDRVDLRVPTTGVRVRDQRPVVAYTIVTSILLAALVYATAVAIDGWAKLIVLGAIMLTAVGAMIAVNPLRRG